MRAAILQSLLTLRLRCAFPVAGLLLIAAALASPAAAQFSTVINIPPMWVDPPIASNTQINIYEFGFINGLDFGAVDGSTTNVELNLHDGDLGGGTRAYAGSVVNFLGGAVHSSFHAFSGADVNLSGGVIGDGFRAESGSSLTISGGEFRMDGTLVPGLETLGNSAMVSLEYGSTLSGTLADGTPFNFTRATSWGEDFITPAIELRAAALPAVGDAVIEADSYLPLKGIRAGQTLNLHAGGQMNYNFQAGRGSTLVVDGGTLQDFEAVGATVNISSGDTGSFDALDGAAVSISGGVHSFNIAIAGGSSLHVSGGTFGGNIEILAGSEARISGGTFGDQFRVQTGGSIKIVGGDFRINGVPVVGLETPGATLAVNIPVNGGLSGTLADGSPFVFDWMDYDIFDADTITLEAADVPAPIPGAINLATNPELRSLRDGQTLVVGNGQTTNVDFNAHSGSQVVVNGGTLGRNFEAMGSHVVLTSGTLGQNSDAFDGSVIDVRGGIVDYQFASHDGSVVNVSGGTVRPYFDSWGGEVNISGGVVGEYFRILHGGVANISGGQIGDRFRTELAETNISGGVIGKEGIASFDSVVNIAGGTIGDSFWAADHSVVNIAGGQIGSRFAADGDSIVNISGGQIGDTFIARGDDFTSDDGSIINLFGTSFMLNGVDITGTLTPGAPLTVTSRNVPLTGVLADGSPFDFFLGTQGYGQPDFFDSDATLTLTLVDFLPGDFNRDNLVDSADYVLWRKLDGSTVTLPGAGADGNFDGRVTRADRDVWRLHLGEQFSGGASSPLGSNVPEPTSVLLLFAFVTWMPAFRSPREPFGARLA